MSRIFEALQRAHLERSAPAHSHEAELVEDFTSQPLSEFGRSTLFGDFNHITSRPWKPIQACLPALEEYGETVEQFRRLRTKLTLLRSGLEMKTIVVSSGMPSEGKTFVTSNLAISLARHNDSRVLLIDGDLRRPTVHTHLGTPLSPGLAEFFAGSADSHAIMQRCGSTASEGNPLASLLSKLAFIPAGNSEENLSTGINSNRFRELITSISPLFDWILIDTPPVLAVSDAVDLAQSADAVLLVARAGVTPYDVAQHAKTAFSNSRLLGFVLNEARTSSLGRPYHQYYADKPQKDSNKG